jgi:hypothetical protein
MKKTNKKTADTHIRQQGTKNVASRQRVRHGGTYDGASVLGAD